MGTCLFYCPARVSYICTCVHSLHDIPPILWKHYAWEINIIVVKATPCQHAPKQAHRAEIRWDTGREEGPTKTALHSHCSYRHIPPGNTQNKQDKQTRQTNNKDTDMRSGRLTLVSQHWLVKVLYYPTLPTLPVSTVLMEG